MTDYILNIFEKLIPKKLVIFICTYPIWFILVIPVSLKLVLEKFTSLQTSTAIGIISLLLLIFISLFTFSSLSREEREEIYIDWDKAFYWSVSYHFIDSCLLSLNITYINSFNLTIIQNLVIIGVYVLMGLLINIIPNHKD